MAIDPAKIPACFGIDASVLIAFVRPQDAHHANCRALITEAIKAARRILIPAPAWAEFVRQPTTGFPRVKALDVVDFDEVAANMMGQLPSGAWRSQGDRYRPKFDAQIASCVKRHGGTALVSTDQDQLKMAKHLGLEPRLPSEFTGDQGVLF